MAENERVPFLTPKSENEFLENTPMRFTTLSSSSSVLGGSSEGGMISLINPNPKTPNNICIQVPTPPPKTQHSSGVGYCVLFHDLKNDLTPSSSKKPKGRPPGSLNKPKSPVLKGEDNDTIMKLILIQIPNGKDIVETLINYARHHHAGISVLSGTGFVSNVTLCHPMSHVPALPIRGPINMISLTGTYVNANCGRVPPQFITNPPCSSFSIYLSGSQGHIVGGVIRGKVLSAGDVVISATLLRKLEFHRLASVNGSIEEVEDDDPRYVGGVIINDDLVAVEPNNTAIGSTFGAAGGNSVPLNRLLPHPAASIADENVVQCNHFAYNY